MVGYWPFNAHACGFWFLPMAWQFSCDKCMELSGNTNSSSGGMLCANHFSLEHFLTRNAYSSRPIFVGLSSIGRCASHHFGLRPFNLEDFNGYPTENIKYMVVEIH